MLKYIMLANKNFNDINPMDCGYESCSPDFIVRNRVFSYYILHFAFKGSGTFEINGTKHILNKGQICIVKPNTLVTYYADKNNPWYYAWIGFNTQVHIPLLDTDVIINLPQAEYLFRDIINAESINQGREHYICAKIHELITLFYQKSKAQTKQSYEYALWAQNYIDNNYYKKISLDELAKNLMISKSYFLSVFKNYFGKTPYQYLIEIRLTKAAELISIHRQSIGYVAFNVGYEDIYTFSKAFKKHYGISPSSFHANNDK